MKVNLPFIIWLYITLVICKIASSFLHSKYSPWPAIHGLTWIKQQSASGQTFLPKADWEHIGEPVIKKRQKLVKQLVQLLQHLQSGKSFEKTDMSWWSQLTTNGHTCVKTDTVQNKASSMLPSHEAVRANESLDVLELNITHIFSVNPKPWGSTCSLETESTFNNIHSGKIQGGSAYM